jgi:hypothetical protein
VLAVGGVCWLGYVASPGTRRRASGETVMYSTTSQRKSLYPRVSSSVSRGSTRSPVSSLSHTYPVCSEPLRRVTLTSVPLLRASTTVGASWCHSCESGWGFLRDRSSLKSCSFLLGTSCTRTCTAWERRQGYSAPIFGILHVAVFVRGLLDGEHSFTIEPLGETRVSFVQRELL